MPQNQDLIQSLIELREHYQTLQVKCDRTVAHAIEQIARVDALLVDQLTEPQHVESLLKLRLHYQTLHSQQQQQAESAKQQIAHVNALLAEQAVSHYSEPHSTIEAGIEPKRLEASTAVAPEPMESPHQIEQSHLTTPTSTTADTKEPREDAPKSNTQQSRALKTPLLPQYQHLTKSEAVELLLQENEGRVLHIDYIIRALHGALDLKELRAEKPRMNDTLRNGVEKGLWNKVADAAGCYTINSQPIEQPAQENSSEVADALPLLPRYQQMSFTGAVATVVQENAGEILTPETVARALYGELAGKPLTEAKAKVGKTLWNGAKQGRWQSVPGKLGEYTLR